MNNKKFKTIFTLIFLLLSISVIAGNFKGNHPLLVNYQPRQYQAGRQIWDIAQGKNGLMYFVAGEILEYGDHHWHSIPNESGHILRSVHSLSEDTILVGGNYELGLFVKDKIPGVHHYKSLTELISQENRDFGEIWQIEEHNNSYFLRAGKAVFQYTGNTVRTLSYGSIVEHIEFINDTLFVHLQEKGIGTLTDGDFTPIPGGKLLQNKFVRGIKRLNNGRLFVFTRENGLFIQEKDTLISFNVPVNEIIKKVGIEEVCNLSRDRTAIGTIKDGIFIINNSGQILQHINKQNGLTNNTILSLTTDYKGNLWAGMDKGIAYMETNSPFSVINSPDDIGTGYVAEMFDNNLYLGTNQGLFKADTYDSKGELSIGDVITPVPNTTGQVWSLNKINDRLYSGQHNGTFLISNNMGKKVNSLEGVWTIKTLQSIPHLHLASTYRGFFLLEQTNNGGLDVVKKLEVPGNSREFIEDAYGNIWRTSGINEIIRFRIHKTELKAIDIKKYELIHEGKIPERIKILGTYQRPVFATDIGIFEYDQSTNQFVPIDFFNNIFKPNTSLNEILEDDFNRVWYSSRDEIGYYSAVLGQVRRTFKLFEKVKRGYTHGFGYIKVLSETDVLFHTNEGFIHYNGTPKITNNKEELFKAYISDVETHSAPERWIDNKENSIIIIPAYKHAENSLQFSFTSNSFENPEAVEYSYILDGFNSSWSDFSKNTIINFTNLREGDYTLRVKARDLYGFVGKPAHFQFSVLPPFYRTVAAYIFYTVIVLLSLATMYILRKKQLVRERNKMELQKKEELKLREQEFQKERLIARERITHLENEKLQQDLKYKARELSNSTINVLHKNELLQNIKQEIQLMSSEKDLAARNSKIKQLIRNIDIELESSKDLEVFDSNLNAVHEEFVERLTTRFPGLTSNDIRLSIFLKMNKTTKEIATLMNLSVRGVETSRYRLRKKMELDRDDNLSDVIMSI